MLVYKTRSLLFSIVQLADFFFCTTKGRLSLIIFPLGLSLHLFPFICPVVTMFSSHPLLNICPVNNDCLFIMDLIRSLSIFPIVRRSLFVTFVVRCILSILLIAL